MTAHTTATHYSTDVDAPAHPWRVEELNANGSWRPIETSSTVETGFRMAHRRYATEAEADSRIVELRAVGYWTRPLRAARAGR